MGTTPSQADDYSSQGSAAEPGGHIGHDGSNDGDHGDGDGDSDGDCGKDTGVHVSPMCARCLYLTSHPLAPLPSTAPSNPGPSLPLQPPTSAGTAVATTADVTLGHYRLCTVNREIQQEVLQVC